MVVTAVNHDLLFGDTGLLMNRFHDSIVVFEIKSQQIIRNDREFGCSIGEHQGADIKRVVLAIALLHRSDQKSAFGRDVGRRFGRSCRPGRFGIFTRSGLRLL